VNQSDFQKNSKDELVNINEIFVDDNNGSTFLIIKNYHNNTKKDKYKNKINYHYELVKFSKGETETHVLDTKNKFINDLKFFENNEQLYLIGYYSNVDDSTQQGLYITNFDKDNFILKLNKHIKFDTKYLKAAFQNNILLSPNNDYLKYYNIEEFYFLNGSFYLFSEVIYSLISNQNAYVSIKYGNVSMIKLDSELNIMNSKILKRDTATKCSYLRAKNKFIIYFWGFKKTTKKGENYQSINNKSKLLELLIDENFNISEKETKRLLFNWRKFINVNDDYTLFFTGNKKEKKIMKLILE